MQIDDLSNRTTTTYDAAGNTSTVKDANNNVTTYAYDAINRQISVTDAISHTSTTAYDKVSNVTSTTNALNQTTTYQYDAANRRTVVIDSGSNTTTSTLDHDGNTTKVTDPTSQVMTMSYDALNHQTATIDPLSHTSTTVYDAAGQSVGTVNATNDVTQNVFDSKGQSVGSVDANGQLPVQKYDANGNLVSYTDPDGNTTKYVYDSNNRQILSIDPTGATTTTAYDSAGRVTSVTDRDNRQTTYAYDAKGELISETWRASGGSITNTQTFTYDNIGNELTAADTNGTITYTYDSLNRVSTETDVWGLTLTYSYDSANRQTLVQDSKAGVLTNAYDSSGRLSSVQFGGVSQTQARIDLGYDSRNELTGLTRYGDVAGTVADGTTSYAYDATGNVTSIDNKNSTPATLSYYNYQYDSANRVTQETWASKSTTGSLISGTHTYAYDATSQLISADGTNYNYDANGNQNSAGYTTGSANRMTNDGTYTYTYDSAGNMIEKQAGGGSPDTWLYTYDQRNLLTSVVEKSNGTTVNYTLTYTYDVLGERVQQSEWTSGGSTVTTRSAYTDAQTMWATLNTSNVVQERYLWGNSLTQLLAQISVGGATLSFALTDHLGSVHDLTDGGTILDHIEYGAFGSVTSQTSVANGSNFGYTCLWYDATAGIVDAEARAYSVSTHQWMQEDPIAFKAGDSNIRRYVRNDSPNAIDPTGLEIRLYGTPVQSGFSHITIAVWNGQKDGKGKVYLYDAVGGGSFGYPFGTGLLGANDGIGLQAAGAFLGLRAIADGGGIGGGLGNIVGPAITPGLGINNPPPSNLPIRLGKFQLRMFNVPNGADPWSAASLDTFVKAGGTLIYTANPRSSNNMPSDQVQFDYLYKSYQQTSQIPLYDFTGLVLPNSNTGAYQLLSNGGSLLGRSLTGPRDDIAIASAAPGWLYFGAFGYGGFFFDQWGNYSVTFQSTVYWNAIAAALGYFTGH